MTQAVSGPGAYSQRTDMAKQPVRSPGGLPYGQNQAITQQQQAAPLAQTSNGPAPIPIHAPTQAPAEPVTAGADRGPGPDSSILTARPAQVAGSPLMQALSNASAGDASGALASLLVEAMKRGL